MLAYTPHPYSEALDMRPSVSYIPYATSYNEQTGDIITFAQFGEGNLVGKNVLQNNMHQFLSSINDLSTDDDSNY